MILKRNLMNETLVDGSQTWHFDLTTTNSGYKNKVQIEQVLSKIAKSKKKKKN